jgi:hypothetical protein
MAQHGRGVHKGEDIPLEEVFACHKFARMNVAATRKSSEDPLLSHTNRYTKLGEYP